ncbi:hypothetical protein [Sorangium sp. So ce145]|uniref:Uncharacterized protein n=2 Tax=Sorangium cellulosum TaxID=56 RepID=A9FMW7_SORC5|nr:hypothetical protein predicted by Glimmer/Critica [Sorangium cellulosum So ce56]
MRLERYAEVLAHVVYFRGADLYEVLARLGVAPEDWEQADAEHTAELALSAKRNQGIQALRFSSAFARTRRSLEAKRPSLASLGPMQRPAAEGAAPVPVPPPPAPAPPALAPPQGPAFVSSRSPTERDEVSPWAANAHARPASDGSRPPAPPRSEGVAMRPSPPAPLRRGGPPSPLEEAAIPQGTADIKEFVPRRDMPFQPGQARAAGQSAQEGKRLQRFDPQTGRPLDPPLGVDAPKPGDEGSG